MRSLKLVGPLFAISMTFCHGALAANCTNMDGAVSFSTSHPTGLGHCAGEVVGSVTNRTSQPVDCRYAFYKNGIKTGDGGGGTIGPGQTVSGEGGGIWTCGADTIKYACFPHSPDSAACKVNF
jgi:hypothetical protein